MWSSIKKAARWSVLCGCVAALTSSAALAQVGGFKSYRLLVFCGDTGRPSADFWYNVPDDGNKGRPLMGLHTACAGNCGGSHVPLADALSKLPSPVSRALQAKVDAHQAAAAAGTGARLNCLEPKLKCEPPQVRYEGHVSCDCNGDGTNESNKSFEACGVATNWPTSFTSNCKDWAQGTDSLGYGTYPTLQQQGRDWLNGLHCPALSCEQDHKSCVGTAENELQKCLTRNKLVPIKRNCFANDTKARKQCDAKRTACLRRAGELPGPQPQPLPTPGAN
jgi:hypothetical protein